MKKNVGGGLGGRSKESINQTKKQKGKKKKRREENKKKRSCPVPCEGEKKTEGEKKKKKPKEKKREGPFNWGEGIAIVDGARKPIKGEMRTRGPVHPLLKSNFRGKEKAGTGGKIQDQKTPQKKSHEGKGGWNR